MFATPHPFPARLRIIRAAVADPRPGDSPTHRFLRFAALKRAAGHPISEAAQARLCLPPDDAPTDDPPPAAPCGTVAAIDTVRARIPARIAAYLQGQGPGGAA